MVNNTFYTLLQATGARLGTLLQSFASIGCGLTIGFVYSWKLTLFIVAFAPFIMVAGFLQMKVFTGTADGDMDKLEEAGKVRHSREQPKEATMAKFWHLLMA